MEIISTELYPRHIPKDPLPKARTVTVVGQVLQLNENNRTVVIQTELESKSSFKFRIKPYSSYDSAVYGVRRAEKCQVH